MQRVRNRRAGRPVSASRPTPDADRAPRYSSAVLSVLVFPGRRPPLPTGEVGRLPLIGRSPRPDFPFGPVRSTVPARQER